MQYCQDKSYNNEDYSSTPKNIKTNVFKTKLAIIKVVRTKVVRSKFVRINSCCIVLESFAVCTKVGIIQMT